MGVTAEGGGSDMVTEVTVPSAFLLVWDQNQATKS